MTGEIRDVDFTVQPLGEPFRQVLSIFAIGADLHRMQNVARKKLMCLRCIRHDGSRFGNIGYKPAS